MPTPASLLNKPRLKCLICGRYLAVRSGRLVEACSQSSVSGLPTSGQSATAAFGGGTWKAPPLTSTIARSTESAMEVPNR